MNGSTHEQMCGKHTTALVLAAHGSSTDPRCAAPVHRHANTLSRLNRFDEVHCLFWKQPPYFHELGKVTTAQEIIVVPLMTADGYYANTVLPRELKLNPRVAGQSLRITLPIGILPNMTNLLAAQAIDATRSNSLNPSDLHLLIVGHGTQRDPLRSGASTYAAVRSINSQGLFKSVHAAFLEQEPRVHEAFFALPKDGRSVIIVPNLIASGGHAVDDIPAALGAPRGARSANIHDRQLLFTEAVGERDESVHLILQAIDQTQEAMLSA